MSFWGSVSFEGGKGVAGFVGWKYVSRAERLRRGNGVDDED